MPAPACTRSILPVPEIRMGVYQDVATAAGTSFKLTFWVGNAGVASGVAIRRIIHLLPLPILLFFRNTNQAIFSPSCPT